ncbi:MAG: pyridoxal-phosphate dependent enzyme [Candidatus Eremiobacteraeota bacterium]|nr:pyridoxal-phosphate dependent enzyme [Candidatus Eremiobacteraeota bacterium]MCW5868150.1 pyridoxal-phosphate dependent enzyme [Candidatus Eremiobacteraeota bacterium]
MHYDPPEWGTLQHIEQARLALPGEVVSPPLRQLDGVGLMCENLQVTGAYKVRAICHIMNLKARGLGDKGLALASSGNFAVALAWAGRHYGVPVTAVMMRRSHPWKVERVKAWGGQVVFSGDSTEERTAALHALRDQGIHIVDHLNDPQVLVGHATLGLDLAPARPRQVVIPASTGGLLVATSLALKQIDPLTRIVGVQPGGANAMVDSLRNGELRRLEKVVTECDALTANRPGDLPWELAQQWVDDMVEVSEEAVRDTVRYLVEEAKLVVEPGGAAGLAAYRSGQIPEQEGTWVVLSGGNIAPARLAEWLSEGPPE